MTGHPGDTLASALLANGVRLVGRSFKYHRPRGILSAGSEEPNALVELRSGARREPNTRATTIELYDGLDAASQNRWPSLKLDVLAVNQLFAPIFGAGFYYKTFMWPASFWEKLYEPAIRRAAGLGRAAGAPDPDHYEKAYAFCDVLVIGGGAAGLAAALAAARSGARVILCEEDFHLGGRLLAERCEIDGRPAIEWVTAAKTELEGLPDCRIMRRSAVVGVYDGGTYAALERVNDHVPVPPEHEPRQRLWRIVAKRAVLCAGAIERAIVFGDNDRPGVMLAGAVRAYVNRFGVAPGGRAVVFAGNDDAFRTAADLAQAGVEVAAVVDARRGGSPYARQAAERARARYLDGAVIHGVRGRQSVKGVEIKDASGATERIDCDLIAMSGGWSPTIHLTTHLNGKPVWDEALSALLPGKLPPGMSVAGAACGQFGLGSCLAGGDESRHRGCASLRLHRLPEGPFPSPRTSSSPQARCGRCQAAAARRSSISRTTSRSPTWSSPRARASACPSMSSATPRSAWRPTRARRRISAARPCSPISPGAISARSAPPPSARPSPPSPSPPLPGITAVRISVRRGSPRRINGRKSRARCSSRPGLGSARSITRSAGEEPQDAVNREVANVRAKVGICDVSTLGKIDVQGSDAGIFLDRVYANTFSTLPVGKARYGLMLREDGFVLDDGTTARLRDDHYFMTTTTANAVRVMQHLEFCQQCLWPELDVEMVSVTEQWAQFAVAGPRARDVLQRVVDPEHDISNAAFPYLAVGEVSVCGGTAARLFRLSFSGELAYEIAVPARFGDALVRAIMEAGSALRHCALRHRGARRAPHREGPPRGRRAERPDLGARSRLRQAALHQEGLHRPLHGGAPRFDRSGKADSGRPQAGRA